MQSGCWSQMGTWDRLPSAFCGHSHVDVSDVWDKYNARKIDIQLSSYHLILLPTYHSPLLAATSAVNARSTLAFSPLLPLHRSNLNILTFPGSDWPRGCYEKFAGSLAILCLQYLSTMSLDFFLYYHGVYPVVMTGFECPRTYV